MCIRDSQNGEFMFNKENKLAVDIVLIDEATMINGTLSVSYTHLDVYKRQSKRCVCKTY